LDIPILQTTISGSAVYRKPKARSEKPLKDGDPDNPILKQAKAEYAKLQ
jgi:hypothetical protein